jgi:hypothetical protein
LGLELFASKHSRNVMMSYD